MKIVRFVLLLIIIAYGGLVWSGWGTPYSWNQKVTIEVETPTGIISNSTVLTYTRTEFPARLNSSKGKWLGLYGEAPFIEIEPGNYIFALSLYEVYAILHDYTFAFGLKKDQTDEVIDRYIKKSNNQEIISINEPILFAFRDLNDPTSIQKVSPSFLGSGIKLKSVKYSVTDEPRTRGKVNKILPWLAEHRGRFVPGKPPTIQNKPNVSGFNRSILSRHWACTIDGYMMSNLTYGFYKNGINCGL